MSSGRSARLPPTPNAATTAANKPRGLHATLPEPNSNNVLPTNSYGHMKSNSNSNNGGIGIGGMPMISSGGGGGGVGGMTGTGLSSGMGITGYTNFCSISGGVGVVGGGGNVVGGSGGGGGSITTIDAATEGIPSETIDALGPELAVATSQVLENLSEAERKMIIEVLNRDENVRQRDATRIM
ncbi:keratin, type II cytoskeletal 60 kDa, component III-like [Rhagoletis pomonella]|uniref:keratin, type II cytoskeletal 60 kDa, component III-like n=1 Tax=Rhagoletis pomonella TaxID=28610 RepID=UPI00177E3AAE|nr:keratin, type II cytoskeletal 60 kDa, component III-like [Rhagoletis pomonella]